MSKHIIDKLIDNTFIDLPAEDVIPCPFDSSLETIIESRDNEYPYMRCLKCGAGFYKAELRAGCDYFKIGVTKEQCLSCRHRILDLGKFCFYNVGILEPPVGVKKIINEQIKKYKQSTKGKKIA